MTTPFEQEYLLQFQNLDSGEVVTMLGMPGITTPPEGMVRVPWINMTGIAVRQRLEDGRMILSQPAGHTQLEFTFLQPLIDNNVGTAAFEKSKVFTACKISDPIKHPGRYLVTRQIAEWMTAYAAGKTPFLFSDGTLLLDKVPCVMLGCLSRDESSLSVMPMLYLEQLAISLPPL